MNKVSKRDFLLKPNEYIKPCKFILTLRGEDKYVVTIEDINVTTSDVTTSNVTTNELPTQKKIEKVLTTIPGMKVATEVERPKNIASGNRYAKMFTPNWQQGHTKYACGCKKDDKTLCPTHSRA